MNSIKILALLLTVGLLASCGDDGDSDSSAATVFDGEWKVISLNVNVNSSTVDPTTPINTSSNTVIEGTEMNYTLNLDNPNWTTAGEYTYSYEASSGGFATISDELTISDVSGEGTYSITDGVLTLDKSFFDFSAAGMSGTSVSGEQMADVQINANNQLVISQNQTQEQVLGTIVSTTRLESTSVWERQ